MDSTNEWTGFSEEDLRRIKNQTDGCEGCQFPVDKSSSESTFKESTLGSSVKCKKSRNKKSSLSTKSKNTPESTPSELKNTLALSSTPMMSSEILASNKSSSLLNITQSKTASTCRQPKNSVHSLAVNGLVTLRVKEDGRAIELVNEDHRQSTVVNGVPPTENNPTSQFDTFVGAGDDNNLVCINKKLSLEEFQMKQKMIEEQNKWRRAMLTKAIADRKKKTLAETEKLTHIQTELQKLDSLVSNDVSILRNQIEVASVEFNDIQKRYEKAEREFVDAKVELFRKMERKEKLTEHLCKIIEENEMRKAKKLSELMDELQLESLRDDECLVDDGDAVLPQLCAFNDITYAYCTTFRPTPSSPSASEPTASSADKKIETNLSQAGDDINTQGDEMKPGNVPDFIDVSL